MLKSILWLHARIMSFAAILFGVAAIAFPSDVPPQFSPLGYWLFGTFVLPFAYTGVIILAGWMTGVFSD